jgi:hypothetical protein
MVLAGSQTTHNMMRTSRIEWLLGPGQVLEIFQLLSRYWDRTMPYIGEQPAQSGHVVVTTRVGATKVEVTVGEFTVTTRSGTVKIGVT